jgi:hypothetical protein
LSDGTASITYSSANEPTSETTDNYPNLPKDLVIPSTVSDGSNSYTVSAIGNSAFIAVSQLETVSFPNTLKRIEYKPFYYTPKITEIVLPKSVQYIHKYLFDTTSPLLKFQWIPDEVSEDCEFLLNRPQCLKLIVIGGAISKIQNNAVRGSVQSKTLTDLVWYSNTIPEYSKYDSNSFLESASVTLHVLPGMKAKFEADAAWSKVGFVQIVEDAEKYLQNEPETGTDNTNENDITVTIRDTDTGYVTMSYDKNTECVLHVQRLASSQSDKIRGITITDSSDNILSKYTSDNIPADGIINLGKLSQSEIVYVAWDTAVNVQTVYTSDDHDTSIFSDNGNLMIQTTCTGKFLSVYAADGTTLLVNQKIKENYTLIPLKKDSIVIVCYDGKSVKMKI